MSVEQLYLVMNNGQPGYLAVLDERDRFGKKKAILWRAGRFVYNVTIPICNNLSWYAVKEVNTESTFDKYIKMFNPVILQTKDKDVGTIRVEANLIVFPNGSPCKWQPHFEELVSKDKFKRDGDFLVYEIVKPIDFTVPGNAERYYGELYEKLIVDTVRGRVAWKFSVVQSGCISHQSYYWDGSQWVMDGIRSVKISGFKWRKNRKSERPMNEIWA